jgi:hypothetical protein
LSGVFSPLSIYALINREAWGGPEEAPGLSLYFSAHLATWRYFGPDISPGTEKGTKASSDRGFMLSMRARTLAHLFGEKAKSYSPAAGISRDSDEPDYDRQLLEALKGLPAETLQNAALLFDHGSEESLGFFDDLQNAGLYTDLYRFFFEARIALEQDKIRSRYTR